MENRHVSFLPIPALIVLITALHFTVGPKVFFEPLWLLPVTNTVFVTAVCFLVAYIALRNYQASGRIQVLLLGCGLLSFGIGGVVAGWLRDVPGAGANLNVTIYNTAALLGGIFHFAAALMLLAGVSPEVGSKRKAFWLIFSYAGIAALLAGFTAATLTGMVPPFFVQGVGPTPVRQWVLGLAGVLFAFSFLVLMGSYLRNRERFLYWYSSALALTAISLTAFFIQRAVGSPVGWAGRVSQYLGGVYFLVAVVTAKHSAEIRRTSLDNVITASLSPSEEKFRALAENSPDIIDRFDRELRHIYVNPAGLRLYGKPAGFIIGKTIEQTGIPEPYCSAWKQRILTVFATGVSMQLEDYFPGQEGMEFFQSHCVPEYGPDGTVANVLVLSRNLSERKRAEEQVQIHRQLLQTVVDRLPAAVNVIRGSDLRIQLVNPAYQAIAPGKEMAGKTLDELWPESEGGFVELCRHVLATGEPHQAVDQPYMIKRSEDGPLEAAYFNWSLFRVRLAGDEGWAILNTAWETTERRRAEEEIKSRNRVLDGIGRIFQEALKCETEEELAKTCLAVAEEITASQFGFVGEIGADGLLHEIAISDTGWQQCSTYDQAGRRRPAGNFLMHGLYGRVLLDGKSLLTNAPAEHPDSIGTPPGHPELTSFLCVPLFHADRVFGMMAVGNREGGYRPEELKTLEALAPALVEALQRKRTEEALIRSEKLVSVGRLAATIAHEINNPLEAATNALYLIGKDQFLSGQGRAMAEVADRELRRAAQIARRTLGFYREPNMRTAVVVADLLGELAALYETRVKNKNARLQVRYAQENAAIQGNSGEMRQLFSNLLANSIDAVGETGTVRVRVGRAGAPFLRITVADSGSGIEPQNLKRIFEPFFTTKRDVGTGLGLWISEQIVKKHGGTIRVRSRPGCGTVFSLSLPAAAGVAATTGAG